MPRTRPPSAVHPPSSLSQGSVILRLRRYTTKRIEHGTVVGPLKSIGQPSSSPSSSTRQRRRNRGCDDHCADPVRLRSCIRAPHFEGETRCNPVRENEPAGANVPIFLVTVIRPGGSLTSFTRAPAPLSSAEAIGHIDFSQNSDMFNRSYRAGFILNFHESLRHFK